VEATKNRKTEGEGGGGVVTPPARTWARSIIWSSTMRCNMIGVSWHMPGSADGEPRRKRP
jgi:hypothetical protein